MIFSVCLVGLCDSRVHLVMMVMTERMAMMELLVGLDIQANQDLLEQR